MHWIDAHGHVPLDIPEAADWWQEFRLSAAMNICVDHADLGGLTAQRGWYRALATANPDLWAWATSFSREGFGQSGWAERAVEGLAADFRDVGRGGAGGCKVWKNIGMELKDPDTGGWVLVDDPRFSPVFDWLERQGRPLLMHIAEPVQAWRALDPKDPHFVDTAARFGDLLVHAERHREGLIAFFHRYQGRILWGVDFVLTRPVSQYTPEEKQTLRAAMRAQYELERRFFTTDEVVTAKGRTVRGLALPNGVLEQLTVGNARRLYWGSEEPGPVGLSF